MTTIGVSPQDVSSIYPLEMPTYSYNFPCYKKAKIAAVQESMYHPKLPTFREIDRDNTLQRMPESHCRSSTYCTPDDFKKKTSTMFLAPPRKLASLDVTSLGKKIHRLQTLPEDLRLTRKQWSQFLDRAPERFHLELPPVHDVKDMHFNGYSVRYLRPDIPETWGRRNKSEPYIDQFGRGPVPQSVLTRHRDPNPTHAANVALWPYYSPKPFQTRKCLP